MDDDFYEPLPTGGSIAPSVHLLSGIWNLITSSPVLLIGAILLALPLVFFTTRPNGNSPEQSGDGGAAAVWMMPYSNPFVGHWFQL